ncbi:MAG: DUF4142 domain-containing protein [Phycisphaerales bacterium]|nr:DUF4142 domain-containing protein [Phycisphaerales bacterium]
MKTNRRRNVSAALILTPAALLAACSTSDGWQSARSDTADSRYDYNGRSRSDVASRDRGSYTTADGRTVYYSDRYSNDPYGDGVSGGPGTRAAALNDGSEMAYTTRTNERNNPNWRDGPTRFDNDNPSQDNSSSQYNTGVARNQSPAEGTVNNQNLAKGTVQPQNHGRYQDQGQNQQGTPTQIDNTNRRWESDQRIASPSEQEWRDRQWNNQNQLDRQNPSNDNSSSQYNTGVARNSSPNEGTVNNQNIAKGTAQSGYRTADGRWVNAPQSNTQSWYSRQDAARNQSDASTNPSNSNVQQGQPNWQNDQNWVRNNNTNQNWNQGNQQLPPREQVRDPQGNWIERNLDTTNMTTADQQAAARRMSDPATNPTNSNTQFNQVNGQYSSVPNNQDYSTRHYPVQNTNPNYSNQTTASTNRAPSNGVEPLGPQNNWGAGRTQNNNQNNNPNNNPNNNIAQTSDPANRGAGWTDNSKQVAARQMSDPATNPTNSNAQIGQQSVAGLNQSDQQNQSNPAYSGRPADLNAAGQSQVYASSATADQKILSLLHFKNQNEIELGHLAATNGSSAAVKDFGNMLVREHTSADARVMTVASQTGTALMSDAETQNMIRAENAAMAKDRMGKDHMSNDLNREKMADDSQVMKNPVDELRGLSGADFDKAFAQKMVKGHEKLASAIEKAKPQVRNEQTRQLLSELLPTIRMHERMARQLPGYTETASTR